jgi:uncharacterized protein with FMN-binding domain
MSDEEKVSVESTEAPKAATPAKKKHWPIVISVLAIIVIAVFVAFLHWHEQPTFCSTMCHTTMQKYVDGYYSEDPSLEVTAHQQADVTCLGCHWTQAKMMDLVNELVLYATDSFTDPLPNSTEFVTDEFCGACHDGVTAQTKEEATEGWAYDPHNIPEISMHEGIECGSCHSVHKQSTWVCGSCHEDSTSLAPTYWAVEENETMAAVAETYGFGMFDPHNKPESDTHAAITCATCHETNTIACAQCHANSFTNVPEGWSLPETTMDLFAATDDDEDEADDEAASDGDVVTTAENAADGTYTATGKGIGGSFEVTVTIEGGAITAVEVGDNSETQGIGSEAIAQLPDLIVEANGTDGVDGVSGASITSSAIFSAVQDCLAQATA